MRTRQIVHTGNAYYSGETHAISGSGTVYTGKIGVQVRFSSMTVSGLVTDFADAGGNAWEYRYGNVETIRLPAGQTVEQREVGRDRGCEHRREQHNL